MSGWERMDPPRRMWGVFNVEEPYSITPHAILCTEREAEAWIAWAKADYKADPDGSEHMMSEHYAALPVSALTGEMWNGYEPAPAEDG